MTQIAIQIQVDAIKKATAKALRNKGTALKFLTDAGIIESLSSQSVHSRVTSKTKKR